MRIETVGFHRRRISMTSLIDVIFLLLLFFMLSSTFSRFSDVELTSSGTGTPSEQLFSPAFIKLSDQGLMLNGQALDASQLNATIADLQVSSNINALILSVNNSASAQDFVDVLVSVRTLKGISLQIVK